MANLPAVTDETFETSVLASTGPVLVDFWAPWCGPCRMMEPVLDRVQQTESERLRIVKLNVDENMETARRYNVRSIPAMLLFRDGAVVETIVGAQPQGALMARLTPHLG